MCQIEWHVVWQLISAMFLAVWRGYRSLEGKWQVYIVMAIGLVFVWIWLWFSRHKLDTDRPMPEQKKGKKQYTKPKIHRYNNFEV